jgi:hypothetical protein
MHPQAMPMEASVPMTSDIVETLSSLIVDCSSLFDGSGGPVAADRSVMT